MSTFYYLCTRINKVTYKYMYGQNTVFIFRPLTESNK